ncbi:MAG: sugar phosphate nucleotidyltransferase [Chlorobiota bacterium]
MNAVATILAGGVDVYLWPESREQMPKFLLPLLSDGSMLQSTLQRLRPLFSSDRIAIATTASLQHLLREHLPNFPTEQFIIEPVARNTAPCLAYAALWWERRSSPDVLVLFPADHAIAHLGEFHQSVETAVWTAYTTQRPVLLGLPPRYPETRFGYLQVEECPDPSLAQRGVLRVRTFAEKPDRETAQRFIDSGDFLWNTGIVALPTATLWDLLCRHLPDYYSLFAPLLRSASELSPEHIERIYRQLRPLSLEHGLLEPAAAQMLALRCSFDWTDVGTWDEVYRRALKDPRGNVLHGDVIAIDTSGCYVSALGGKPIALIGLNDLIVVDTDVATLICPRGASERVAEIVHYLRRKKMRHLL